MRINVERLPGHTQASGVASIRFEDKDGVMRMNFSPVSFYRTYSSIF